MNQSKLIKTYIKKIDYKFEEKNQTIDSFYFFEESERDFFNNYYNYFNKMICNETNRIYNDDSYIKMDSNENIIEITIKEDKKYYKILLQENYSPLMRVLPIFVYEKKNVSKYVKTKYRVNINISEDLDKRDYLYVDDEKFHKFSINNGVYKKESSELYKDEYNENNLLFNSSGKIEGMELGESQIMFIGKVPFFLENIINEASNKTYVVLNKIIHNKLEKIFLNLKIIFDYENTNRIKVYNGNDYLGYIENLFCYWYEGELKIEQRRNDGLILVYSTIKYDSNNRLIYYESYDGLSKSGVIHYDQNENVITSIVEKVNDTIEYEYKMIYEIDSNNLFKKFKIIEMYRGYSNWNNKTQKEELLFFDPTQKISELIYYRNNKGEIEEIYANLTLFNGNKICGTFSLKS